MLLLQYIVTFLGDFLPRNCACQVMCAIYIMEVDSSRRTAGQHGLTTRVDGVRTPTMEIILNGLIYDNDVLSSFLKVFDPKWRLEIIVQHFQKYAAKGFYCLIREIADVSEEIKSGSLEVTIMELDSSRRTADQHGLTTRVDGVRTPTMEIILDGVIYDNDVFRSFLKVFDPKWRLEIIVQHFQKVEPCSLRETEALLLIYEARLEMADQLTLSADGSTPTANMVSQTHQGKLRSR
ncbi:negative regulator of systemic acquired resistance [Perilla frutescens var. frutescens]|nr:negative regulator of systemic acquired resistance [Perilla frutescens var. frutescens]